MRKTVVRTGFLLGVLVLAGVALARDVPFVPTPQPVVDAMLEMAELREGDVLYDLGSGDGRTVVSAAGRPGVRAVGVDIDPQRIADGRRNAQRAGVTKRARFVQGDLFEADVSEATVVTLYLLPDVNLRLRPRLLQQLRPGARIVSHSFTMGEWQPDRKEIVAGTHPLYLWIVPAQVAGRWQGQLEGADGREVALDLRQSFQRLEGTVTVAGRTLPIFEGEVRGNEVSFVAPLPEGSRRFTATLPGGPQGAGALTGEVKADGAGGGAPAMRWTATRLGRR